MAPASPLPQETAPPQAWTPEQGWQEVYKEFKETVGHVGALSIENSIENCIETPTLSQPRYTAEEINIRRTAILRKKRMPWLNIAKDNRFLALYPY
jgi:hypothetical protein